MLNYLEKARIYPYLKIFICRFLKTVMGLMSKRLDLPIIGIGKISQIAIVVKDLNEAVGNYWKTLGIGPWQIYRQAPPELEDTFLRGRTVSYSMKLAFAKVGNIELELIEPLDGPSIYKEFLEKKGGGLHHIASFQKEDLSEKIAEFKSMGIGVLMSGRCGKVEFYYMDTEPVLGLVYELVRRDEGGLTNPESVYPATGG